MNPNHRPAVKLSLLLLALAFLAGCLSGIGDIRGRGVDPKHWIPLTDGGPHPGVYQTDDIELSYRYRKTPGELDFSAEFDYSQRIKYNFIGIKYFFLDVYFIDAAGTVLDRKSLFVADTKGSTEKETILKRFALPEGTEAMAFGYRGAAEDSGQSPASFDFWSWPVR